MVAALLVAGTVESVPLAVSLRYGVVLPSVVHGYGGAVQPVAGSSGVVVAAAGAQQQ